MNLYLNFFRQGKMCEETTSQLVSFFAWAEHGSRNIAGSVRYMDYEPATNKLYLLSDGGTLWEGDPDLGNWVVLNQDNRFNQTILKITTNAIGGTRILASANSMVYSDTNGSSFSPAAGVVFPVGWGGILLWNLLN